MNKGWLELESDPGVFTLLLEDIGVEGVQVEEIYDLQNMIDGPVYGFIFLFRWVEERRSRKKNPEEENYTKNEETINSIFFAKQIITNSCATHALLSILMNCERIKLGATLTKLKEFSKNMNPESKGLAIGNLPELAKAHNSHARPEPYQFPEKQQGLSSVRATDSESYHFVSYVPINGHLFELDGLKQYPIDHGPWSKGNDWVDKFKQVISDRLGIANGGDSEIRFSLMAVVPDKIQLYQHKLATLHTNRNIVLRAIEQVIKNDHDVSEKDKAKCMAVVTEHGNGADNQADKIKNADTEDGNSAGDSANNEKSSEVVVIDPENCSDDRDSGMDTMDHSQTSESVGSVSDSINSVPMETEETKTLTADSSESRVNNECSSTPTRSEDVVREKTVISVTPPRNDITEPLTIETRYGGSSGPGSESTDTASEVGSCFSSPGSIHFSSCQNSPLIPNTTSPTDNEKRERGEVSGTHLTPSGDNNHRQADSHRHSVKRSNQGFTPKDLLALFKNVEKEICSCEVNLKEEKEKRRKYKIDDGRRTHNYDQFIVTFLRMLDKYGKLKELIDTHSLTKKKKTTTFKGSLTKKRGVRARNRR